MAASNPRVQSLVLDAAPLVTQAPLVGLAEQFYIPVSVLAELRDARAREYLENLQMTGQIQLEVREPGAEAMQRVIAFAKKTGDYSVLSQPDLHVIALTYAIEVEKHGTSRIRSEPGGKTAQQLHDEQQADAAQRTAATESQGGDAKPAAAPHDGQEQLRSGPSNAPPGENADAGNQSHAAADTAVTAPESAQSHQADSTGEESSGDGALAGPSDGTPPDMRRLSLRADDSKSDTGRGAEALETDHAPRPPANEARDSQPRSSMPQRAADDEDDEGAGGEWITPHNITKHKNRSLGLVQDDSAGGAALKGEGGKRRDAGEPIPVACMTGDFAVQNVLMQMGLALVGTNGVRIQRVKSWVLRCHACYKCVSGGTMWLTAGYAKITSASSVPRAGTRRCCAYR